LTFRVRRFRVWGLGFRVSGVSVRVCVMGFIVSGPGFGSRV
jgi:hypothetical protein